MFPLLLSIAQEQFAWSVALVLVSFVAAGGRMFIVQRQLLIRSEELQQAFPCCGESQKAPRTRVFVKDLKGRYLMINSAGARFPGRSADESRGQDGLGTL